MRAVRRSCTALRASLVCLSLPIVALVPSLAGPGPRIPSLLVTRVVNPRTTTNSPCLPHVGHTAQHELQRPLQRVRNHCTIQYRAVPTYHSSTIQPHPDPALAHSNRLPKPSVVQALCPFAAFSFFSAALCNADLTTDACSTTSLDPGRLLCWAHQTTRLFDPSGTASICSPDLPQFTLPFHFFPLQLAVVARPLPPARRTNKVAPARPPQPGESFVVVFIFAPLLSHLPLSPATQLILTTS